MSTVLSSSPMTTSTATTYLPSSPMNTPNGSTAPTDSLTDPDHHRWCCFCKAWDTPCANHTQISVFIDKSVHPCIDGVLKHHRAGSIGRRSTTQMLLDGVDKWLDDIDDHVISIEEQQEFVDFVWYHMRQSQRKAVLSTAAEKAQKAFIAAKSQLSHIYFYFPEEVKDDAYLKEMYLQLGNWSLVISSEQRRIASIKKHDKEECLIANQFGGDRAAYNNFKRINENVSHSRVRDVPHQLMSEFAGWMEKNPDFLNPGTRCTAVETSLFHIKNPLNVHHKQSEKKTVDVSLPNMIAAIGSLMSVMDCGRIEVTLNFERSPKQSTMSDKYPILEMHGCERLVSGSKHAIIAVHLDKLVFEARSSVVKRLPPEYHKSFSGLCTKEGLYKTLTCHQVFATPNIALVECTGRTAENKPLHVVIRKTVRSNCEFDAIKWLNDLRMSFVTKLRMEAVNKKTAARKLALSVPVSDVVNTNAAHKLAMSVHNSDIVGKLAQLKIMRDDGDLTTSEFNLAKKRVFNELKK